MDACGRSRWSGCRIAPIRFAAAAVLVAAFLSLGAVSAGAMDPSGPWFHFMMPNAHVGGGSWSPNTPVTVQVNTDGVPGAEYTNTVMSGGDGWINSDPVGWNVEWGDVVTVSDGTHTKTHTITYVTIAGYDLASDTVHGFASYDTTVQVEAHNNKLGQHANRMVNSDGNPGGWAADFHVVDEYLNPTVDIDLGTHLDAIALDADGDGTQVCYDVPNPMIMVDSVLDEINGWGWPANSEVTVTVDDPGPGADLTYTMAIDGGGTFHRYMWEMDQQNPYDIRPGMLVTAVSGSFTKTLTVTGVAVSGVDVASDVVTGTAAAGSDVEVSLWGVPGYRPWRHATADGAGRWSVSFATTDTSNPNPDDLGRNPFDITPGRDLGAEQFDTDGDRTRFYFHIADPRFFVSPGQDGESVQGNDWPRNSSVTIEVDNYPPNGVSDFAMSAPTDEWGNFGRSTMEVAEPGQPGFDITPFSRVTVSSGTNVKVTDVTALHVTGTDAEADTVSGSGAGPFGSVRVYVWGVPGYNPWRTATADVAGNWSVSFATTDTTNPNLGDQSRNPFDLVRGTNGAAQQTDVDGDGTQVGWFVPNPRITVATDSDAIWGNDFRAGSQVTVTVDDPANGAGVDFTMTVDHDGQGNFFCTTAEGGVGFDMTAGMTVAVTDGETTKGVTLTNVVATGADVGTDIVTGTAEPGSQVQVCVQDWGGGMWPMRFATTDGSGHWSADFSVGVDDGGQGWGRTVDLVPGSNGNANQTDGDGDVTQYWWRVPNPWVGVDPVSDTIFGEDWASSPGQYVTITLDDPANGPGIDFTTTAPCDWQNAGFQCNLAQLGSPFDVTAGMTVRVVNGDRDKSHVVTSLLIGGVDTASDIVTGTAEPGAEIQAFVKTDGGPWPTRTVTAGEDGVWLADFSVEIEDGGQGWGASVDIDRGSSGAASQYEIPPDGDQTQIGWSIPNPQFNVDPEGDNVWGNDFPASDLVTITIDDPANGAGVDFTMTADQQWGGFWRSTGDVSDPAYDIRQGMLVVVTDGVNTKEHVVRDLHVGGANQDSDVVTGTAEPGSEVLVSIDLGYDVRERRPVADGSGLWIADFSTPVDSGDEGWGRTLDLQPGTNGGALQGDSDGDCTQVPWFIPDPRIAANAEDDNLQGWGWPPNVPVLLAVDNLENGVGVDFTMVSSCDNNGNFGSWAEGYDLKPGMLVTATSGEYTRTLIISNVEVTSIDIDNDVVSGVAEPDSRLTVSIWAEGSDRRRVAQANSEGAWSADFGEPAPDNGEGWGATWDLIRGSEGDVRQDDADGDQTQTSWRVPNPWIWADPQQEAVGANEFLPNAPVDVTVEDLTTPLSPDVTATEWSDESGWAYFGNVGDITGDCVVTVSDGVSEKILDVASLSITDVNVQENLISGTADPNASVDVGFNDGYWGSPVVAGPDGVWVRDFDDITEVPIQLQPGHEGQAMQRDDDGDQSQVDWRISKPYIEVSAVGDWLEGHDWDPGVPVIVTVDDPAGPDFVTTAYADSDRYLGLWDTGFDVKSGQLVTFTDGSTTCTHTVTPLLISGWDEEADTVWGTADPLSWVRVELWDDEGTGRDAQADAFGNWIVDYTDPVGPDPSQRAADLVKGTDGRARQSDDEGDQTSADFHIPNPRFTASPAEDVVWGSDWTPNAAMTVTIDASGTPPGIDATYTTHSGENGDFGFGYPAEPMGGEVNAGDTITVTDGVTTKTHVVTDLAITSFNRHTGLITGVAAPNSWFNGWYEGIGGGQGQAGPDGLWTCDLTGGTAVPLGASGGFEQFDDDSDSTIATWRVPDPQIGIDPQHDSIEGSDWPAPGVVTITIDDTTTAPSPDFETTRAVEWGEFNTGDLGETIDIVPGMVVTVTDGDFTRGPLTVNGLTVTAVDAATDKVYGTAKPGSTVRVSLEMELWRWVDADSEGLWVADFSVAGSGGYGERAYDLVPGDSGVACQGDEAGFYMVIHWSIPKPRFAVNADLDQIEGFDFTPSANATVTVNSVFAATYSTNGDGAFGLSALGADVSPGDVVVVTDGTSTKSLTVAPLVVLGADAATDHAWGTTTPMEWVVVLFDDTPAWSYVQADSTGSWDAPFNPADPRSDMLPGTTGTVRQEDADGDETVVAWSAPTVPVVADDAYGVAEDTTLTVPAPGILANDEYLPGSLDVRLVTGPTHGALDLDLSSGGFTYRPAANFYGTDVFYYQQYNGPLPSAIASVTIAVSSVNDAPVAHTDGATATMSTTLTVDAPGVLGNDTDVEGSPLTAHVVTTPTHGTLALASDGAYAYRPNDGYVGADSFTYRAFDGADYSAPVAVSIVVVSPGDTTPPVTTASGVPSGWSPTDVTVTLAASDEAGGSGVASIRYAVGAHPAVTVVGSTAQAVVSDEGVIDVAFRAVDTSGNVEATKTVTVRVDKTPPPGPAQLSYSALTTTTVTLSWPDVIDVPSGLDHFDVIDNRVLIGSTNDSTYMVTGLVPGSIHTFGVRSVDRAGNRSQPTELMLKIPNQSVSGHVEPGESGTVTLAVPSTGPGGTGEYGTAIVTITDVTVGGTLTLIRSDNPPFVAPPTFRFLHDYFDVDFSGRFTGTLTITVPYDPSVSDARAVKFRIQTRKSKGWVALPTTVDLVSHTVTARLDSLSPLALVGPEAAATTAKVALSGSSSLRTGGKAR